VYQVLISLVFALSGFYPTYSQQALDALLSRTSSRRKNLDVSDALSLEDAFNTVHHELDHLFLPFVSTPHLKGNAWRYLDMQHLIDTVRRLKQPVVTSEIGGAERAFLLDPVERFLRLAGDSRRTTL